MTRAAPLSVRSAPKPVAIAAAQRPAALAGRQAPAAAGSVWRMFRRPEPSVFQRCLAIHMWNAAAPSALE